MKRTTLAAVAAIISFRVCTAPIDGIAQSVAPTIGHSAADRLAVASDPYVDRVRTFMPGQFAGFGSEDFPAVVFGPPEGGGARQGGLDVLSIGHGGSITLVFRDNVVFDGPGDDLIVFENPFHVGSDDGPVFAELATVSVSVDRTAWQTFPFDATTREGLAGQAPVLANSENKLDPLGPLAGGDRFDLADLPAPLTFIRYVRIDDGGDELPDPGNAVAPGAKGGFDLDSIGAANSTPPALIEGVVSAHGEPVEHARVKLIPADDGRKRRRKTRSDGTFRFARLVPSGQYLVRARKRGVGRVETVAVVDMAQLHAEIGLRLD